MGKDFSGIIGNDALRDYFSSAIRKEALSHAYILLGPKGCGKHTLAYSVAAALNCENKEHENIPCMKCNSCKKISERISADIIPIGRDGKATIGVEAVRFIKNDIATFPNDGNFKVYIIEDAHTMTKQAQNALLLTLEEPPEYAVFILLCENIENILETIKSRAPILRLNPLPNELIVDYLKENSPSARSLMNNSPDEFSQLLQASSGSIGYILELIDGKEKKQILQNREISALVIKSVSERSLAESFSDILSMFSQKREEIAEQLEQIQLAVRDLMLLKKSDNPRLLFFTDMDYAEELSYSFSQKKLCDILDLAEEARLSMLKNANIKLTLVNFLTSLL